MAIKIADPKLTSLDVDLTELPIHPKSMKLRDGDNDLSGIIDREGTEARLVASFSRVGDDIVGSFKKYIQAGLYVDQGVSYTWSGYPGPTRGGVFFKMDLQSMRELRDSLNELFEQIDG